MSVARLGQNFTFTFAANTFTVSPGHTETYAAYGLPGWLSFDPISRNIAGTPLTDQDLGIYPVQIMAALDAGRMIQAFDTVIVLATADPAPTLNMPLTVQIIPNSTAISSATAYPSGTAYYPGVNIPSGWSFSVGLQPLTFADPDGEEVYYQARLSNGGRIPTWLSFDNVTVTFWGVLPSQSEVLEIDIYGSDRFGYADVKQSFFVVVEGVLSDTVTNCTVSLGVAAGYPLRNVTLASIAGLVLPSEERVTVDTSAYAWLGFDKVTEAFNGTPPVQAIDSVLPYPLVLVLANGTPINISVAVYPFIFTDDVLPNGNVAVNGSVHVSLAPYLNATRLPLVMVEIDPPVVWLSYDPVGQFIGGVSPFNSSISVASVLLTALDLDTNATSYATFNINLDIPPPFDTTSPPPHHGLSRGAKVALIVLCCLVGLFTLLCLVVTFLRRSSKQLEAESPPYRPPNPTPEGGFGDKQDIYSDEAGHSIFTGFGRILISHFGRGLPQTQVKHSISYPRALGPTSPHSPPRPAPNPTRELTTIGEELETTGSHGTVRIPDNSRDSLVSFYTGHTPETYRRSRAGRKSVSEADSGRFENPSTSSSLEGPNEMNIMCYYPSQGSVDFEIGLKELESTLTRPGVVSTRTTWSTNARSMANPPGF